MAGLLAVVVVVLLLAVFDEPEQRDGMQALREALFEELVEMTLRREAFSPIKNKRLGLDFATRSEALRDDFIAAGTDVELLRAILRLSNLRRDGHLRVVEIAEGLRYPPYTYVRAPIRFAVDYGDADRPFLFVSDLGQDVADGAFGANPRYGDELVGVNGRSLAEHLALMRLYIAASSDARLWLEYAVNLSSYRTDFDPALFADGEVTYALQTAEGGRYSITLPYVPPDSIEWSGNARNPSVRGLPHRYPLDHLFAGWLTKKSYPGFSRMMTTASFSVYKLDDPDAKVLLIENHQFKKELEDDVRRLVRYALSHDLLSHDVIWDLTSSRGGSKGWVLLRTLASRPFQSTLGNVRISDIIPRFIAYRIDWRAPDDDATQWMRQWLTLDLRAAFREGKEYSDPVPFKLQAAPRDADGVLEPPPQHFRGRLVILIGPLGRSQVDQLAAMVIDNGLGHSIGMPTAGSSNTWEWRDTISFENGDPVARYMWTIGHTIRPNGEILEGNAAPPAEFVPMTRENFRHYSDVLIERALAHLRGEPADDARRTGSATP